MNDGGVRIGVFGKLPSQGDFLRLGRLDVAEVIDPWFLASGMDQGRHADLVAGFAGSPPVVAFLQRSDRWWCAVIFPSRDAVGRHSPFAVAAAVDALAVDDEAGALPLLFAPFVQAVMLQHRAGWPVGAEAIEAAATRCAGGLDITGAGDALAVALEATSAEGLWQSLLGDPVHPRRQAVLSKTTDIPPPGVRIAPLGNLVHLAFWLMVLQNAHGRPPALVALHPGSAVVLTDRPRDEQCFAALWPAAAPPSFLAGLCDLAQATAGGSGFTDLITAVASHDVPRTLRDLIYLTNSLVRSTARHRKPRGR
jgi:type VI secretion system ImpM family protein